MPVISVFNVKGGVGKTTLAVNLAWASSQISSRKTLIWDLDYQGGAGFLLGKERRIGSQSLALFDNNIMPEKLTFPTGITNLDLLPADAGLTRVEGFLRELGKKKRLAKLTDALTQCYDRIILDCPPQLGELADQVVRASDVILAPIVPSPLSLHALHEVQQYLIEHHKKAPPILPIFSMVDTRRKLHQEALSMHPNWPVIPMASIVEQMGTRKKPLSAYAASSVAAKAFENVWTGVERKIIEAA